ETRAVSLVQKQRESTDLTWDARLSERARSGFVFLRLARDLVQGSRSILDFTGVEPGRAGTERLPRIERRGRRTLLPRLALERAEVTHRCVSDRNPVIDSCDSWLFVPAPADLLEPVYSFEMKNPPIYAPEVIADAILSAPHMRLIRPAQPSWTD